METAEMGRAVTDVTIENAGDLWNANQGGLAPEQVRRVDVPDALVDTGATTLKLPTRIIQQLGLLKSGEKRAMSSTGATTVNVYGPVRVTIQGRSCPIDAMEVPNEVPVLIGQIILHALDLVVDPRGGRLIGNPAHDGEHVLELY
jgi:predicted aspartyl protease